MHCIYKHTIIFLLGVQHANSKLVLLLQTTTLTRKSMLLNLSFFKKERIQGTQLFHVSINM